MANGNFIVQNGLQIGPLTIDAATGTITTTGNIISTSSVSNEQVTTLTANILVGGSGMGNITLQGNIIPAANLAYDLGTPTAQFRHVYIGPGTLYINGKAVLQDNSGTITVSTTSGQNLQMATSGGGILQLTTNGGGGGVIAVQGPMQIAAGNNVTSSDGNAIQFANQIGVDSITSHTTNNNLSLSANGTGSVVITGPLVIQGGETDNGTFVASTINAGTIGNTGASLVGTLSGTVGTTSQPNIATLAGLTSFGTTGATATAQGNMQVNGNLNVSGNITTLGNVYNVTITGNSGQFFGNTSGFNAMYMGIPTGYFIEPQMVAQVSSNFNGYAGFNLQNVNSGQLASTDIFLTPNNGTINDGFFDIGVASSTYNYTGYGLLNPNDMYLIASGNVASGSGNLVLSTSNANDIVFAVQGANANNEVMRITRANVIAIKSTVSSSSTSTGALTVAGGVGVAGTVSASTVSASTVTASTVTASTVTATTLNGTLGTAAQTNVTSVGTLTGLTVSGTIAASTNNNINIGSSGSVFATVYATTFSGVSTTAKYADLAENYQGDKSYAPGTVVMFGGSQEVTVADADATAVAGVVSTNPAHLMNGGLTGANVVALALQGRVPCQVIGPVKKGDILVSAGFGYAKVNNTPATGTIIGKALQDVAFAGKAVIEVVVGRF
jgi:hypothetical protein